VNCNSFSSKNDSITPLNKQNDSVKTYSTNYLLGKFIPEKDTDFIVVSLKYGTKEGMYLRKETYNAFIQMHDAAKLDGVTLKIISSTRNFDKQKNIWEAKWNGERIVDGMNLAKEVKDPVKRASIILKFSSMPGTSRHHWGTDIDINSLEDSYFLSGQGKKEYEWLTKNAVKFGFYQPYTPKGKERPTGYEEEKWHWTYKPISKDLTLQYAKFVTIESIIGFSGAETAESIDIINKYVLGIHPDCLK
jgi:LAS superfamily LD-carboxypeptidase LdcB